MLQIEILYYIREDVAQRRPVWKSSSGEVSFSYDVKGGLSDWLIDGAIYRSWQIHPQSTIAKNPPWRVASLARKSNDSDRLDLVTLGTSCFPSSEE